MDAILAALEAISEQRSARGTPAGGRPAGTAAPSAPPAPRAPARPAPASSGRPGAYGPEQHPVPARAAPVQGMFEDGNSLLRAIIAAEVLGPPVALKEHHLWTQQPNEPST